MIFNPQKLTEAREAAGMSRRQLSLLVGLNHSAVSAYERGLRTPSINSLAAICGCLRIDIGTLFTRSK